jgi:FkbM family methyltransferase
MHISRTIRFLAGLSWTARAAFAIDHFADRLHLPGRTRVAVRARIGGHYRDGKNHLLLRPGTIDTWAAHPGHECETHTWLRTTLGPDTSGIMLDIGAYCGTFALRYRDYFSTIFAFEPHPDNFSALETNLRLSKAEHIVPLRLAISDSAGVKQLFVDRSDTHSLLSERRASSIPVVTTTIDTFVSERKIDPSQLRLVKIDIEGVEISAIRGATTTLRRGSPILVLEANTGPDELALTSQLGTLGYQRRATLDSRNLVFSR